jgi:hypothetical protein
MQAELVGRHVVDGHVVVSAEVFAASPKRKQPITDVFVGVGPLLVEQAPHVLWVRVGNASFRTPHEHHLCLADFMNDVRAYFRSRIAENEEL